MHYSIIVPAYSRPGEVRGLLDSLLELDYEDFDIIIADNSPDESLKQVVQPYSDKLPLTYLYERGLGAGAARNLGAGHARGDFVVFIDSDCTVPPHYLKTVDEQLGKSGADAYGGPDRAADDFTNRQKAISYAMTSLFTTGGIRGGKHHAGQYQPRSFNMGVRRDVFNRTGGFRNLKVSEDIDLSIRLRELGCSIVLIGEAYVYHKRRSTFGKFFRQVSAFGRGRWILRRLHPGAVKPVHLLPSLVVLFLSAGAVASFFSKWVLLIWSGTVALFSLLVFADAAFRNKSMAVGLLSVLSSWVMLTGYGSGMIGAAVSAEDKPDGLQ